MSYSLFGFIMKKVVGKEFEKYSKFVNVIDLNQNFVLVPMIEELFDDLNKEKNSSIIVELEFMNKEVEKTIKRLSFKDKILYCEIELFGGDGAISFIVWERGRIKYIDKSDGELILSKGLEFIGVEKEKDYDEFDTLELGRERSTGKWIK